jgi:hypothetical protein
LLTIAGDSFPKSLQRVFVSAVIHEEVTGTLLSIGNEVVADGASFFARDVKDKPAESRIPEPESDPPTFELDND